MVVHSCVVQVLLPSMRSRSVYEAAPGDAFQLMTALCEVIVPTDTMKGGSHWAQL